MLTYQDCINLTQKRDRRKLCNNTYLIKVRSGDSFNFHIVLHNTAVVIIFPSGKYQLNSGGWKTPTTKDRINMYSPVKVYQKKHIWYVSDQIFFDGYTVSL
jgi:hypothetical protein